MASSLTRTNERLRPRLLTHSESKIPKPRIFVAAESSSSFPVQLRGIESVTEPTTPAPVIQQSLDLLIDTALKECVDSAGGARRSWLLDSERGTDVEELLDDLEFEDCIETWPEGSSPGYSLPSDNESMGSWSPDTYRIADTGQPEPQASTSGHIRAMINKLRNLLTWLKFQPLTSTPATSKTSNTPSSSASSCRSSRSLSSAFDRAAVQPMAFLAARWHKIWEAHDDTPMLDDDADDDFKSACSELEEFTDCMDGHCGEESHQVKTRWEQGNASLLSSPGQISLASGSSGADSEQLHSSLLKSSLSRSTISEWLSSGSLQEELSQLEVHQRRLFVESDGGKGELQRRRPSI